MRGTRQQAERVKPVAFGMGLMKLQEKHKPAEHKVPCLANLIRVEARSDKFTVNEDATGAGVAHSV
jgi:hypothetical protein